MSRNKPCTITVRGSPTCYLCTTVSDSVMHSHNYPFENVIGFNWEQRNLLQNLTYLQKLKFNY